MSGLQRMFVLLNLVGLSLLGVAESVQAKSVELTQGKQLESRLDQEVLFTSATLLAPKPSEISAPSTAQPLMAQLETTPSEQPMMETAPDATIQPGEAAPDGSAAGESPLETVPTGPASGQTLPNPLERPDPEVDALGVEDSYPTAPTIDPLYEGQVPGTPYPATPEAPFSNPSIEAQDPSYPPSDGTFTDPTLDDGTQDPTFDDGTQDPTFDDGTQDPTFDDGTQDPTFDDGTVDDDPSTTPDPALDEEAQTDPLEPDTSDFDPGRTTRSGPSYIGVGGNIGLGDGDTALGEGSFAIFSKVGVTPNISVRPSVLFSDDPAILLPVTIDFIPLVTDATEDLSSEFGLRVSPFVGAGAAFSTGDDSAVDFLATGGVDIALSDRLTGVVSVSASLFDNPAVGLLLGVGYNF